MGIDWGTVAAIVTAAGGCGWLGNVVMTTMKSRGQRRELNADIDLRIETHRDALTFQLLAVAKTEIEGLRKEISLLRPLESHLLFFEQAIGHIEVLLDPDRLPSSERDARAFVKRMRRRQSAVGNLANAAQVVKSADALAEQETS